MGQLVQAASGCFRRSIVDRAGGAEQPWASIRTQCERLLAALAATAAAAAAAPPPPALLCMTEHRIRLPRNCQVSDSRNGDVRICSGESNATAMPCALVSSLSVLGFVWPTGPWTGHCDAWKCEQRLLQGGLHDHRDLAFHPGCTGAHCRALQSMVSSAQCRRCRSTRQQRSS